MAQQEAKYIRGKKKFVHILYENLSKLKYLPKQFYFLYIFDTCTASFKGE